MYAGPCSCGGMGQARKGPKGQIFKPYRRDGKIGGPIFEILRGRPKFEVKFKVKFKLKLNLKNLKPLQTYDGLVFI